jgi:hypothetical protein
VNYLRNGGDAFTLQKILGHSRLEMTRWYTTLNDEDVQRRHAAASPGDRLGWQVTVRDQEGDGAHRSGVPGKTAQVGSPRGHALHVV